MLQTLRTLLSSRKAVIGLLTSLITSAAAIALIFGVHLDTDQVVTILTPWVLLASVLMHGIATEDAAAKGQPQSTAIGSAGTVNTGAAAGEASPAAQAERYLMTPPGGYAMPEGIAITEAIGVEPSGLTTKR